MEARQQNNRVFIEGKREGRQCSDGQNAHTIHYYQTGRFSYLGFLFSYLFKKTGIFFEASITPEKNLFYKL